jgi:hypothetical protein
MDDFDDGPNAGGGGINDFDPNARVRKWAGQLAQSAAHTVQELTSRKYALPDKNVASQLLMYRQVRIPMRVYWTAVMRYWDRL